MSLALVLFAASALFSSAIHAAEVGAVPQNSFSGFIPSLFITPGPASPTERGTSFPQRNLLQFQPRQCFWDPRSSTCEIGGDAVRRLTQSGKSDYAKLYRRQYKCGTNGQTKETCAAMSNCGWIPDGLCIFVDYAGVYSKSPCVKNAPRTHLGSALLWQCPLKTSARACSKLDGCTWDKANTACFVNESEVFFGKEFPKEFERQRIEVDRIKSTAILNAALSNETFVSMDSYWNSFLEWQVPKTDCPEGYDQLVCDYVDAYSAVLLPTYFYCLANAGENEFSPKDCNADSLCEYALGQCRQTQALTLKAFREADKRVLLPLIPGSTDRKIMKNALICGRMITESDCTGNCQWVTTANLCRSNPEYTQELIISGVDDPTEDPVCLAFEEVVENGCSGIGDGFTCATNKKCQWYPEAKLCSRLPASIARTLIKQEPALKKPYKRVLKTCSRNKSRKTCTAAGSSSSDGDKT